MKKKVYKHGVRASCDNRNSTLNTKNENTRMNKLATEPKQADTSASPGFSVRERYLTKREVADLLRVTPRTIDNMMKRGQLVWHKIGRTVRFKLDALERHLDETARVCRRNPAK
jgi:excisionase family DNA binding protein